MRITNQDQLRRAMSAILKKHGAFFAYSKEQYDQNAEPGVIYERTSSGMIAPKGESAKVMRLISEAADALRTYELKTEDPETIMHRVFANYECQIDGSPNDALYDLHAYGFTDEQIAEGFKKYMAYCVEHDLF